MPERVALSSIKSLTFFSDELTKARRAAPISQLTCVGKICNLFQPEAVQCVNVGGRGTAVNWKCEADLPDSLRFGKVVVSCEGWAGPGDPYVLEGSCGLEYRLLRVPKQFNPSLDELPSFTQRIKDWLYSGDLFTSVFNLIWIALLLYFSYLIVKSCFRAHRDANGPSNNAGGGGRGRPRGSGGIGGFGNSYGNPYGNTNNPPPPPYSKDPPSSSGGWTPGFWTGLGLGGLATSLWNSARNTEDTNAARLRRQMEYDWERTRRPVFGSTFGSASGWATGFGGPSVRRAPQQADGQSEGAGSSNLGQMRRSTGLASSNVR